MTLCPFCRTKIIPFDIHGEPSINHAGEKLYHCDCRNYAESELSNVPRAEMREEKTYSEPLRIRPALERDSDDSPNPEGDSKKPFKLTQDESKMLSAIEARTRSGLAPIPDELRRDTGLTLAKAKGILKKLREKNLIEWDENKFRSMAITNS